MDVTDFLSPTNALAGVEASDKLRLLKDLCGRAASTLGLDTHMVLSEIMKRETLGSTGIGGGIALPHARIVGLEAPFAILMQLKQPIEFDAVDGQPVDVAFFLLLPTAPGGEQLNALACVARKLRDPEIVRRIRTTADNGTLYEAVISSAQAFFQRQ